MANLAVWSFLVILFVSYSTASAKVLICYYGTWATYRSGWGKVDVDNIEPHICTHLVYSFVGINYDGTVTSLDSWLDFPSGRDNFRRFNALKHRNPGLKTLLAVGGYNEGSHKYSLMAANSGLRRNFIQTATQLVRQYGFDGLDMDWEYPSRRDTAYGPADINNFSTLLRELREEFNKHGLLLTAAVAAAPSVAALSYDIATISRYLDFIHLMAYDMYGAWDPVTGHNAPLHRGEGDDHMHREDAYTVDVSVEYWLRQGCPAEKLVLGLPMYGRTFTLASANAFHVRAPAVGAGIAGPYTLTSGFLGYNEFCTKLRDEQWNIFYDSKAKVPYAVQNTNWVSFDDENSLREKVKLAMNFGIAGTMVWSLETDDVYGHCHHETYHLLRTVKRAMEDHFYDSIDGEGETSTTTTTTVAPEIPTTTSTTPAPATTTRTPEIESPNPVPSPDGSPCKEIGLNSHPDNCSAFYMCSKDSQGNWIIAELKCPGVLLWDNANKYCNYADEVNCNA